MSTVSLTNPERVEALKRLGYTEREAGFLCIAALHGGYFLRRQYTAFAGNESAGMIAALTENLLSKKQAVATTGLNGALLFHLSSRPFFNAIGETDNRNRREHSPFSIKRRLMGLDYVLGHPNRRYLATEHEKVDYFSGVLGVPLAALPIKRHLSLKTPSTTARYFVDKFPIFLNDTNPPEPRSEACFCFVDEGSATLSAFETYLGQYAGLWRRLKELEVIYVADTPRLFGPANRRFAAFLSQLDGSVDGTGAQLAQRILGHFEARSLFEKGEMDSFSKEKLVRLRNESEEFSQPKHPFLYEHWKANGPQAVLDMIAPNIEAPVRREASFSTCLLEHRYDLFGKG